MNAVDRFMGKVAIQPDGCWYWLGAIQRATGYGRFATGQVVGYAHRASWELFRGAIEPGQYVCHTCDVRHCVNPDHLFLGTAEDNMRDASRKGRIVLPATSFASDETHPPAKLTNEQVREIRRTPPGTRGLAKRYGVSRSAIWQARKGVTFTGITDES